jgi:hypothetical protein
MDAPALRHCHYPRLGANTSEGLTERTREAREKRDPQAQAKPRKSQLCEPSQSSTSQAPVIRETLQIVLVLSARYVVSEVAWGKDVRPRQRRDGI